MMTDVFDSTKVPVVIHKKFPVLVLIKGTGLSVYADVYTESLG